MGGRSKAVLILFGLAMLSMISLVFIFAPNADASSVKQGARGETVRQIQEKLKRKGFDPGPEDGVFGVKTQEAVIAFQKKNKLTADGVVGEKTAALLGIELPSASVSEITDENINESDLYLMARTVYGEARGESYIGKVAVAAVILNRLKSKEFPSTVAGVIYQPAAFSAVSDGQIGLGTDEECLRACRDALNGWDPTHGCVYYYNPNTATCEWIKTRPMVITIGNHIFCK